MNPVISGQLTQFRKVNADIEYDDPTLFEVFCIHSIENGLLSESIDPFSVHLQGNEFGLDGLGIIVQGEVCTTTDEAEAAFSIGKRHDVEFHFFQSKTSEKLDYGELSKFFDSVIAFIKNDFVDPSIQLQDLLDVKNYTYSQPLRQNPAIRCFFACGGAADIGREAQKLIEATQARLEALSMFDTIELNVVDASKLQSGYRSATNAISASIEFSKHITLPQHKAVSKAFLGFVPAHELMGTSIFDHCRGRAAVPVA